MQKIDATETGTELQIAVPYALKDAFKNVFKTAKWNSLRKTWTVKNTTANKNKLNAFREAMAEALAALENSDETDLTEAELRQLRDQAQNIQRIAEANAQRIPALRKEMASVRDEIERLTPTLADTSRQLQGVLAELERERARRTEMLAPLRAMCDAHGVSDAVSELKFLSGKPYLSRPQKEELYRAQAVLQSASDAVEATFGIRMEALTELANVSANRLDSLSDSLRRHADMYRTLELAEAD